MGARKVYGVMDFAINKIGLPVKCTRCSKKDFVKPRTNLGGWYRIKILQKYRWYCPEHNESAKNFYGGFDDKYLTPQKEISTEEELYKLLED